MFAKTHTRKSFSGRFRVQQFDTLQCELLPGDSLRVHDVDKHEWL